MRIALDVDKIEKTLSLTNDDGRALSEATSDGLRLLSQTRASLHAGCHPISGEISRVWGTRKNASAEVDAYVLQMITNMTLALDDFAGNEDRGLAETKKLITVLVNDGPRS